MIEATYRFTCDRCGKEFATRAEHDLKAHRVEFGCQQGFENSRAVKCGQVCEECFKDFCELAESFFDDLNKTEKGGEE